MASIHLMLLLNLCRLDKQICSCSVMICILAASYQVSCFRKKYSHIPRTANQAAVILLNMLCRRICLGNSMKLMLLSLQFCMLTYKELTGLLDVQYISLTVGLDAVENFILLSVYCSLYEYIVRLPCYPKKKKR